MPLQNRVTPEGDIVAVAMRGTIMGNRGGALHGPDKVLGHRRWVSRQWIACQLEFHGRHREVMSPGRYTELFFLDEATALAAGHRPCFECRHQDAVHFATLWGRLHGLSRRASAAEMDIELHTERLLSDGSKRTYHGPIGGLPPGAIIRHFGTPHVVAAHSRIVPWSFSGYSEALRIQPDKLVDVLTPPSIVAVMRAGFTPVMHPTWLQADMHGQH